MFSIGFDVKRSVTVSKSVSEVYTSLANFDEWPRWSPWLCQEPDAPVTVAGSPGVEGHRQEWNGTFIGAGNMQITNAEQDSRLDYQLNFIKPWKSKAGVGFELAPAGDGTNVTWWMDGNLPFFLFFMKNKMQGFVGSDYERGLKMLKEYLETGSVPTAVSVEGVSDRQGFHYFGKRRNAPMSEIGDAMRTDLTELSEMVDNSALPKPVNVLSIYHSMDMGKQSTEYTTGFIYDSPQQERPGYVVGEVPAHKALLVKHRGPYRHVGNAWAAAMGCARANHKINGSVPMYEIYTNDTHEVAEEAIETEIFVPVKR